MMVHLMDNKGTAARVQDCNSGDTLSIASVNSYTKGCYKIAPSSYHTAQQPRWDRIMVASADPDDPEARVDDPMPRGYRFVPQGNVYITKYCRKLTHDAQKTLYVVLDDRNKPIGLRCPIHIYETVRSQNKTTAAQRAVAVQKRDAAIEEKFEEALLKLFPDIPKAEIPLILKHALKKHSRRVGRAGKLALQDKVKLAVRAHIRHVHTDYDMLLKQGTSRPVAREKVWGRLNEIARQWGGRLLKTMTPTPATGKHARKSKTVTASTRRTEATAGAKKATIATAARRHRKRTRLMSRNALELSSGSHGGRTRAVKPEHTGLRVHTRSMTSGSGLLALDVFKDDEKLPEEVEVEGDAFTRSDEDYCDSDCSEEEHMEPASRRLICRRARYG
ncbi:uncharacterized protein B0T15DRAFT_318671 [Chaetomium strumarium]|uniref:DUF2293 domain-containing protein n=1 Tax=Chaetomium strumarium TaxID=1170767 RepID=A0AAJ0GKL8_9PEZI|nr:hypothetical protein B0T15DRAFT_318671 [Chaetomium strumarium]